MAIEHKFEITPSMLWVGLKSLSEAYREMESGHREFFPGGNLSSVRMAHKRLDLLHSEFERCKRQGLPLPSFDNLRQLLGFDDAE